MTRHDCLAYFPTSQGRCHCQDTAERSPNLTIINRLPDEVLLEIFDFYRQLIINQYDHNHWRKRYVWFNLAHVCRRWRAAMFASSSRLDLNIVVGPKKPGHIKTILSSHLPILIDYRHFYGYGLRDITGSAIWRMRAALGHRDRVREISISFGRRSRIIFKKFIKATTNCHFPALESLVLDFSSGCELDIPATFLRGPDRSDLPLRRLTLYCGSLASISGLLLSATALTDLTLSLAPNPADFYPSQGSSLLSCLQGTQCLRSLGLTTQYDPRDFQSQHSIATRKDTIVPLLKLTRFRYSGPTTFLNDLMSRLSAPSLQDTRFVLCRYSHLLYLSRVIDQVSEEFRSVSVTFDIGYFHLLSSTHSGEIDHSKPASFRFNVNCSSYSINPTKPMDSTPSMKLAMAEELTLNFPSSDMPCWAHAFSLREFLRQFRGVRVLRVNPFVREVGHCLRQHQDDGETILPVLEQVELSISRLTRYSGYSDEEYQRHAAKVLAAFEPCERAGRLVEVYHCKQTRTQSRNASCW
jgi:hypothetical protein